MNRNSLNHGELEKLFEFIAAEQLDIQAAYAGFLQFLQNPNSSPEHWGWRLLSLGLKTVLLLFLLASAEAYVYGCFEFFPNNRYLQIRTAVSSALVSTLAEVWAVLGCMDHFKFYPAEAQALIGPVKPLWTRIRESIFPGSVGSATALVFGSFTWLKSRGNLLERLGWSFDNWLIHCFLLVFALQSLMKKPYLELKYSDPAVEKNLLAVRETVLSILNKARAQMIREKELPQYFSLSESLTIASRNNRAEPETPCPLTWGDRTASFIGLFGYLGAFFIATSLLIDRVVEPCTASLIFKIALSILTMIPLSSLIISTAKKVSDLGYTLLYFFWHGQLNSFLQENLSYRLLPKLTLASSLSLGGMSLLSWPTNYAMTGDMVRAFFENAFNWQVYKSLVIFFEICAAYMSVEFNAYGAILGAGLLLLLLTVLCLTEKLATSSCSPHFVIRFANGVMPPEDRKFAQSIQTVFDPLQDHVAEMGAERLNLWVATLDEEEQSSILEKANVPKQTWKTNLETMAKNLRDHRLSQNRSTLMRRPINAEDDEEMGLLSERKKSRGFCKDSRCTIL